MTTKYAVVTGAGSGVGRAAALALLADGWTVALAGRRKDALDQTASESGAGKNALVVPTDVADAAAVDALFAGVTSHFGRLDVLFNNAGTGARPVPIDQLSVDEWRKVVDINLTGAFLCARAAFRLMKEQDPRGGRIINNGSISAHVPRPGTAAYTATKHGVEGLTKALALDGRRHGIACGQIDIGNARTDMTAGIASGARQADGSMRAEPTFDPRHVADAVRQMANLPLDVNVLTMTIMATGMPYVGRG
jgi:NAD(P)-dependent dehydrogenase (short-subunit alcohol dehydrogenase family)